MLISNPPPSLYQKLVQTVKVCEIRHNNDLTDVNVRDPGLCVGTIKFSTDFWL